MRVWIDKIASATGNVPLRRDARVSDHITACEGYVVAGRVLGEKTAYNQLEDLHGRLVTLHDGDIIVGVLGSRNALHGYTGIVPDRIHVGDRLHLLNLGGVIGQCTSVNPDVGPPFGVEILGSVLVFPEFENREGVPAHIGMNAIPVADTAPPLVPVVYVAGTCMNSGKTTAASQLIRELARRGDAVAGCKLTGVALRRDTLKMLDYGARWAVSFGDAGVASTSSHNAVGVTRGLFAHLAQLGADVIVAELGDGVHGEYGVAEILADTELMQLSTAILMCANDPVGTWGAKRILQEQFDLAIDVVSGPATDNAVGVRYIEEQLQLKAINARTHGRKLAEYIAGKLDAQGAKVTT